MLQAAQLNAESWSACYLPFVSATQTYITKAMELQAARLNDAAHVHSQPAAGGMAAGGMGASGMGAGGVAGAMGGATGSFGGVPGALHPAPVGAATGPSGGVMRA